MIINVTKSKIVCGFWSFSALLLLSIIQVRQSFNLTPASSATIDNEQELSLNTKQEDRDIQVLIDEVEILAIRNSISLGKF